MQRASENRLGRATLNLRADIGKKHLIELFPSGEIVVQGRPAHPGPQRDLLDRDRVISPLGKEVAGRAQDCPPRLLGVGPYRTPGPAGRASDEGVKFHEQTLWHCYRTVNQNLRKGQIGCGRAARRCIRARRSASTVNTNKANQISANPSHLIGGIGSPPTSTPHDSCMAGFT